MSDTPSIPTGTNSTAQTVGDIASGTVNVVETTVEKLAEADVPILAAPVVKTLFEMVVGWLFGYIARAFSLFGIQMTIIIQTGAEVSSDNKALAALVAAQKSGDPVAIQKALAAFQLAVQNLGHADGSATPSS